MTSVLLGPAEIRALADALGVRPTKTLGQNFLHDANTIRRIVRTAQLEPGEPVLEVGPGLGSLTFGLLEAGHPVTAVEIDPVLAAALPVTAEARLPGAQLTVIQGDALRYHPDESTAPTVSPGAREGDGGARTISMVANLPYNVAVPVVLHLLETVPSLRTGLVLVQAEVAERLAAPPGSRVYGVPSVKTFVIGVGASLGIALASAMISAGSDAGGVTLAGYRHAMYSALALLAIGVVTALLIQRSDASDASGADGTGQGDGPSAAAPR